MNFINKRRWFFALSTVLTVPSFIALMVWGLKPNIDFTGGSLVEFDFTGVRPALEEMQTTVKKADVGEAVIQPTAGSSVIVKLPFIDEPAHQRLLAAVRGDYEKNGTQVLEKRIETVGPSVSQTIKKRASMAGVLVVIAIIGFIAIAFRRVTKPVASWKFGVAAVVSLLHDILITMGLFSVLGHFYGVQVDIPFVVALLTIFGYSVNDTIVVFDRIRENLLRRTGTTFAETTENAIKQTVWRSLNTSLTVLTALACLFIFGGESVKYFSLALFVGIFFGTYSSIFLASPLLVSWEEWDRKRRARAK